MNTEIIVALIGMASAVWAPTVTAYVNRNKELRLKKLEIFQPDLDDAVKEIISASHQVLIYCSKNTSNKIIELIDFANSMPFNEPETINKFKKLLYKVMQLLNAEIKEDSK